MLITQEPTKGFAVIGDTQKTLAYEIIIGKEANNHEERLKLIDHIKGREPDFLLVAGDMVALGQSSRDWNYFEELMRPLGKAPLLPVVGNHDYFFLKKRARHELLVRFPFLAQQTWYVERWGPLAIVVLDSNCQYEKQARWLEEQLRELDQDPSVKGVIVSGHHPPFTNSFEVPPHTPTRVHYLPVFIKGRKTIAYISGHCHAYEHFREQGKTFIVTGGGGGPRQHLREGPISRFKDQYPGGRVRPFHYLWVTLSSTGLVFEVWGIRKRQKELWQLESFELPWNI